MKTNLLKILLSSDSQKEIVRKQRREVKANAEKEKAQLERKLWELTEEYEEEE